jgi:hypothetical protein
MFKCTQGLSTCQVGMAGWESLRLWIRCSFKVIAVESTRVIPDRNRWLVQVVGYDRFFRKRERSDCENKSSNKTLEYRDSVGPLF